MRSKHTLIECKGDDTNGAERMQVENEPVSPSEVPPADSKPEAAFFFSQPSIPSPEPLISSPKPITSSPKQPMPGSMPSTSSPSGTISQMILKFFHKESQILSSLAMDTQKAPEIDTAGLPARIQQQVQAQIDNYNKFLVLLSHHPLAVPPAVLLKYRSTLSKVESADSSRLLGHLIFHHRWADIWDLTVQEDITINDMEDMVEQMHVTLSKSGDLLAIWGALEAARKTSFASVKVYALLVEAVQFKFGIDPELLSHFSAAVDSLDGADLVFSHVHEVFSTLELVSGNSAELRAYFLPRILQQGRLEPPDEFLTSNVPSAWRAASFQHVLGSDSRLAKIPGLVFHASQNLQDSHLVETTSFLIRRASPCVNYKDFSVLIQSLQPSNAHRLYILLCRSQTHDEYVINAFLSQLHSLGCMDALLQTLDKFRGFIKQDTLTLVFPRVAATPKGRAILRRFFRKSPAMFGPALTEALATDQLSLCVLIDLVQILNENNAGRLMIRSVLAKLSKYPGSDLADGYAKLSHLNLSEYNTMEVWRFGVTHKLLDAENIGRLFSTILRKAWKPLDLERRSLGVSDVRLEGDFQEQYRHATKSERLRLIVRIQAISQSISTADEQYLTFLLDNIYEQVGVLQIHGDTVQITNTQSLHHAQNNSHTSAFFIADKAGKQYVFQTLIKHTAHFIYKNCIDGASGLRKLSNILRRLRFKSTHLQAAVYEHMVLERPQIALKILSMYEHKRAELEKPLLNSIEQAVFRTKVIPDKDKLELFRELQNRKAQLQFPHKLATQTVALFLKTVCSSIGPRLDPEHVKQLKKMAFESKVPVRLVRKWIHGSTANPKS